MVLYAHYRANYEIYENSLNSPATRGEKIQGLVLRDRIH